MGDVFYSDARAALVAKRHVRNGWLATALTVIVPVFVVWALVEAILAIDKGRSDAGAAILVVSLLIAGVRLCLYASTGFTSAW